MFFKGGSVDCETVEIQTTDAEVLSPCYRDYIILIYVNEVETILHEIRDHLIFVNISKFS